MRLGMYKVTEGKGPESWLLLRSNSSNDVRSLNVSGTLPVNLLLLRWRRDISVSKERSLIRVPWRFAWLRSMPETSGSGLLIPPPTQTTPPPLPTPTPTPNAACVSLKWRMRRRKFRI
ncbi:hypothetical protein Lal_00003020 [Lupinus albus]|nr:hypothetical protein Lal_00003020 [Lupinus albus]